MALPNVAKGDPHINAHNEERAEINTIAETVATLSGTVETKANSADVQALIEQQTGILMGVWTVDPTDPDILIVNPNDQVFPDPVNTDVINVVV